MSTQISQHWRILVGLGVGVVIWQFAGSFWFGLSAGAIVFYMACTFLHVPDNTVCPLFLMGTFWKCIGPGHHIVLWPFVSRGPFIDTRYFSAECIQEKAFSADRIPFVATMNLPYRFLPAQIHNKQRASELIGRGENGRLKIVQDTVSNSTLYIVRQFSHFQLLSGPQQAQIQDRIAEEAKKRLAPFGFEIQAEAFRVIFQGPKDLEAAFIQQKTALPMARGLVTNMIQILNAIRQFPIPNIQHYLDMYMFQVMGRQSADPLTTLLAREWLSLRSLNQVPLNNPP